MLRLGSLWLLPVDNWRKKFILEFIAQIAARWRRKKSCQQKKEQTGRVGFRDSNESGVADTQFQTVTKHL